MEHRMEGTLKGSRLFCENCRSDVAALTKARPLVLINVVRCTVVQGAAEVLVSVERCLFLHHLECLALHPCIGILQSMPSGSNSSGSNPSQSSIVSPGVLGA